MSLRISLRIRSLLNRMGSAVNSHSTQFSQDAVLGV